MLKYSLTFMMNWSPSRKFDCLTLEEESNTKAKSIGFWQSREDK